MRIYIIEMDVFDDNNNNFNNIKEDIKEDNNKNLDLFIEDLYLYIIALIHLYWRKKYIIDSLKFLMLLSLQNFFYIIDNESMMIT